MVSPTTCWPRPLRAIGRRTTAWTTAASCWAQLSGSHEAGGASGAAQWRSSWRWPATVVAWDAWAFVCLLSAIGSGFQPPSSGKAAPAETEGQQAPDRRSQLIGRLVEHAQASTSACRNAPHGRMGKGGGRVCRERGQYKKCLLVCRKCAALSLILPERQAGRVIYGGRME